MDLRRVGTDAAHLIPTISRARHRSGLQVDGRSSRVVQHGEEGVAGDGDVAVGCRGAIELGGGG